MKDQPRPALRCVAHDRALHGPHHGRRPGDRVAEGLPDSVAVAEQRNGEGTGAAVLAARDAVADGPVVVLSGDHPLVTADQIAALVDGHRRAGAGATLLTTDELDPTGYGRIVRAEGGEVERIVETKYTEGVPLAELAIREVNLGTYVFEAPHVFDALDEVGLENGERFLTGVLPVLKGDGAKVIAHLTEDAAVALGINDRAGLMQAEALAQQRILEHHALEGVTFLHPGT